MPQPIKKQPITIKKPIAHPKIVEAISTKLQKDIKAKMNVTTLPPEIVKQINETANDVASTLTKQNLTRNAMRAGKDFFREVDTKKAISDRLSGALKGVQFVSRSDELTKLLDENAKMLFAKRKALINAGFSESEAFQLILAEVSAKKAK